MERRHLVRITPDSYANCITHPHPTAFQDDHSLVENPCEKWKRCMYWGRKKNVVPSPVRAEKSLRVFLKVFRVDCVLIKIIYFGLPWWRSGWESACQCRGHGFEPWSGRIPHAAEWLGPWATTTEPVHLEPVLHNKRGHSSERPAHRDEEWPPLAATRESPCTETKTQHSHKLIN